MTERRKFVVFANWKSVRHARATAKCAAVPPQRENEACAAFVRGKRRRCCVVAGEVAASMGAAGGVLLPYRGQLPAALPSEEELSALPPGPYSGELLCS